MICKVCRENHHGDCRGGTWCDCQHRPGTALQTWAAKAGPATDADRAADDHGGAAVAAAVLHGRNLPDGPAPDDPAEILRPYGTEP